MTMTPFPWFLTSYESSIGDFLSGQGARVKDIQRDHGDDDQRGETTYATGRNKNDGDPMEDSVDYKWWISKIRSIIIYNI